MKSTMTHITRSRNNHGKASKAAGATTAYTISQRAYSAWRDTVNVASVTSETRSDAATGRNSMIDEGATVVMLAYGSIILGLMVIWFEFIREKDE